jgi:hypothetical protein
MCHKRVDRNRQTHGGIVLRCLVILWFCGIDIAGAIEVPKDAAAFDLKEISAFDAPDAVKTRLIFGVYVECRTKPETNAGRYPAFQSDKPLYGSFHVGGASTEANAGYHYRFAMDESAGTGRGYDRMYLDMNLNEDLTDDGFCRPMRDVPEKALLEVGDSGMQVCFEPVKVRIAPADDPSKQLEVMPRFWSYASDRQYAALVTTRAHAGTIKIGGDKFDVVLGHSCSIPGWFDHPDTGLYLFAANGENDRSASSWYGGDRLMAMHRPGGTYYRLAATPSGDTLFVWPYQGPFGVLELKAGGRNIQSLSFSGSLSSKDATVDLTDSLGGQTASRSSSYRLPVGDYSASLLSVSYGTLNLVMLRNRHADGLVGGRPQQGPPIYAIQIREDRPFVLDFSGKPQVVFASPARNHRLKPGEELDVKAVLVDPSLDIMFRRIGRDDSLNPRVVVKRTNGEIVAEGVMPFG